MAEPADPKEACRNGGWQELTSDGLTPFRNQGECVSHAARGLAPLPAASISVFPLFADPTCILTFVANDVPNGTYSAILVNAAGTESEVGPIVIEEPTQLITTYVFLPEPGAPGSLILSRPGFSLSVEFLHECA